MCLSDLVSKSDSKEQKMVGFIGYHPRISTVLNPNPKCDVITCINEAVDPVSKKSWLGPLVTSISANN